MPHLKVWIHLVFSTKHRILFLEEEIREKVFSHIKENAKSKGIFIKEEYTEFIEMFKFEIQLQ